MMFSEKDKSVLCDQEIVNDLKPKTLSVFLREKGKILQENEYVGDGFRELYPQEKIAEQLNISLAQLRNKIYRKKPITREWIIAIAAAYGLGEDGANEALKICEMPGMDANVRREEFIIECLEDNRNKSLSVNEFNTFLEKAGFKTLDIGRNAKKKKKVKCSYREYRYKTLYTYDYYEKCWDSLAIKYLPKMYCKAEAYIKDEKQLKYILSAYSDGSCYISSEYNTVPALVDPIDSNDKFYPIFSELMIMTKKKKKKMDDIVNDSKNYRGRFSANIKNDSIHVFYEEYNYLRPEKNEYYLMEYIDGHYALSIAEKSMFMQEYLSEDEYFEHYRTCDQIPRRTFNSLEEIEQFCSESYSENLTDIQRERKNTFIRLKKYVEEQLNKLKAGEIYIQNAEEIWDNPYDVISYYGVEKEFECKYDDEFGEIISAKEYAEFTDDNGNAITIFYEDIKQAFELGISDIKEICRIKREKGSISSLFL